MLARQAAMQAEITAACTDGLHLVGQDLYTCWQAQEVAEVSLSCTLHLLRVNRGLK